MLNISDNNISESIQAAAFRSLLAVNTPFGRKTLSRWLIGLLLLLIGFMFLPWTQNVTSKGVMTTLSPETRPQTIHTTIAGRIERWYVNEGDTVKKGDTIVFISEVKDSYFDPDLVGRTGTQIAAKQSSISSYTQKADALSNQIEALIQGMKLKVVQAENKVQQYTFKVAADSTELEAAKRNYEIAKAQFDRTRSLFVQDLKSRTQLEEKELKVQETQAKLASAQNKFLTSKNELSNARVEMSNIANEYADKISKAESDRFSALSLQFESEGEVSKMENTLANYNIRRSFYYITAPQDGYLVRALQSGIGETLKEGDEIVSILPKSYKPAIELYVAPIDLPLLRKGQPVLLQFDGWPAIVFSGWPEASYGTFAGSVYAIDRIGYDGKYRILVQPDDTNQKKWPKQLQIGTGARGMAMIKDVPIWYELWRQINGFPPDFYTPADAAKDAEKKKK